MAEAEFDFGGRKVKMYGSADKDAPVVYSVQFEECGQEMMSILSKNGSVNVNLVTVSSIRWDEELSPWKVGKVVSSRDNFTGEADSFLDALVKGIIPEVESSLGLRPSRRVLSGYSMAGLFSLYAAFRSDAFSSIVSASGSLWFPGIMDFVEKSEISASVKSAYFSLGDRESISKNKVLQTTEGVTREVSEILRKRGIRSVFELNKGNHFTETTLREAKGIIWTLSK